MRNKIMTMMQLIIFGGMLFRCSDQEYKTVIECLNEKTNINFITEFKSAQQEELLDKYFDTLYLSLLSCLKGDSSLNLLMERNMLDSDFKKTRFLMFHWHDMLNGSKFSLEEKLQQITVNLKYKEKLAAQERQVASNNLRRFEISDTVVARYPIEKLPNSYYEALAYDEIRLWEFDDSKDFLVKGILLAKSFDGLDSFLQIKVLSVNTDGVYLKMRYLKPGDTLLVESIRHPLTLE